MVIDVAIGQEMVIQNIGTVTYTTRAVAL